MAKSVKKKRRGRPPGRKAPWRPVLSVRVPEEDYAAFKAAAHVSGRTISEEVVWRARQSFEWEKQFGDVRRLLADAQRVISGQLRTAMVDAGYTPVHDFGGTVWHEPQSAVSEAVRRLLAGAREEPQ
jgi:hypothetical protein